MNKSPSHAQCRRIVAALLISVASTTSWGAELGNADPLEFFEKRVRPVLVEHCYSCHSVEASKLQAGLRVDSRAALIQGGDSGTSLQPGDADGSLLVEAVRYESYEMPPKGKLPDAEIQAIEDWVAMGAPWPDEPPPQSDQQREAFDLRQRAAEHWVWQPITSPTPPPTADTQWPRSDIDRFILKRLEAAELRPAPDADRSAVARRLYFDLIGLPPSADQLQAFLDDTSEQATSRLVDQLLESPRFGERWGRHWLDLVRYAESRGHEFDNDARDAYQYRDYVIRALNADIPYDQWVREHIAGDLLESPRLHPEEQYNESILGTGFWFLGEWVHSPVDIRKDEADRFDNMIDVMSKAFLGVTVSCARCHDHKFDAISTADYYALCGFLQGSDFREVRFESLHHNQQVAKRLADLDAAFRAKIEGLIGAQPAPASPPVESVELADTSLVDYAHLAADHFLQNGFIFGSQPRVVGELQLSETEGQVALRVAETTAAVNDSFWNGLKSIHEKGIHHRNALDKIPHVGRTLRTPSFEVQHGEIVCRVQGNGHVVACVDSHRLIAGPLHGETIRKIDAKTPWVRLNLKRYVGHRIHLEFVPAKKQTLAVSLVLENPTPEQLKAVEAREAWQVKVAGTRQEQVDKVLAEATPRSRSLKALVEQWAAERKSLKQQIQYDSRAAMAMLDGIGEDDHVLIRGNASKPGKLEPRHFLTAIVGDQPMAIARGSGRLELAQTINDPNNPLTSRVIVNRVWHHLMGRGIVPTTDDFGVLGQRPTHPELLDYLATRFRSDGQSLKRLIRYVVLSRTYQMSSNADPTAVAADPKNLLWHHRWPKRLEGEAIRDALLSVSGRLNEQMFGEPIPIHLTGFMDGRGRPGVSGPLDGEGRRSIYISVRRNFLSPFMLTFDTPVPFSAMGRRNVSNVPAQALILMNDPMVVQQAELWAQRTVKTFPDAADPNLDRQRVVWMYQMAFARQPTPRELDLAMQFLKTEAATGSQDDLVLWADLAHALINTKEFIFLK
ncbi:Planctomycete cytochrome C [Rosistilla carotiformis]|uniref:Planctomycete cytochrome C n=1 Tax=Rosistilla carotiformis TaxID=2528017 RepID=A0A518JTL0_9BACT|nr:PSD1 and planctomycete cytochrome C domain-containing protein [Rosistilla carotiformis]QDV68875.1 Planctomycete cytochrome C [Rosistilla carotiformis]